MTATLTFNLPEEQEEFYLAAKGAEWRMIVEGIDAAAQTVTRGWSVVDVPPPAVSAESWLQSCGLGGDRQPTLLYLRLNLQAAGKQCPELDQLEQYLQGILALYAADPAPRSDWPAAPITFESAVSAAMSVLSDPSVESV